MVDEKKRIADMVKHCNKAREEGVKILVDEIFLEKIINTFLLIESQCNITGKPREAMRIRINDIRAFIDRSHRDENIS